MRWAQVLRRHPLLWQGAIIVLAIALTAYYTLSADRDFWYDEAMLVQAVRMDGWLAPWQPLSHFEQSSPWGVYLIQKLLLQVLGFQPDLLRLPGLIAYAIGGIATWLASRTLLGEVPGLLGGVWALASLDAVQISGDFKHYVFEFCVTGVLLWLTARAAQSHARRDDVLLLVAAILSIPFSNTVVLVTPGLALLLVAARGGSRWISTMVGGVCFLIAYGIWYLISIRPASAFQTAYPTYRETSTTDLYASIVQSVAQPDANYIVSLTTLALVGAGVSIFWRRATFLPAVPAICAVIGGWLGVWTGIVPISADRHMLFIVPMVALAAAAAVRAITDVMRAAVPPPRRHARLAAATIGSVLALGATVTIAPHAGVMRQQAGQAVAQYAGTCPTFYVDWWTQPSTQLYAEADGIPDRVHGAVDTRSGMGRASWAYRVIDEPARYQAALVDYVGAHPDTCVLTGGREDENALVLQPLAAAGLPCRQIGVVPGIQINRCGKENE